MPCHRMDCENRCYKGRNWKCELNEFRELIEVRQSHVRLGKPSIKIRIEVLREVAQHEEGWYCNQDYTKELEEL